MTINGTVVAVRRTIDGTTRYFYDVEILGWSGEIANIPEAALV